MKKVRRMTKQRRIILEELRKVRTHPRADDLYIMVKKKIPDISLGTIYRNLEILKERGEILEIKQKNFSRFDGFAKSHPHFTCDKCNRVFDVEYPVDLKFNKKLLSKKFSVLGFNIELFGICKNCRR